MATDGTREEFERIFDDHFTFHANWLQDQGDYEHPKDEIYKVIEDFARVSGFTNDPTTEIMFGCDVKKIEV